MSASPPLTDRLPFGSAKSFWTSTTMSAVDASISLHGLSLAKADPADGAQPMSADSSSFRTSGWIESGCDGGSTSSR